MKPVHDVILSYEESMKSEMAVNTVASYMGDLGRFMQELNIGTVERLKKLTVNDIKGYIELMQGSGKAQSSISRTIASLKKFFGYCTDIGLLEVNPASKVEAPVIKRKPPSTLTSDQVVKLLEAPDVNTPKGIRDRAMLELMYASGAKVSEMIALRINDVSFMNETVTLYSNGKRRSVPLGKAAAESTSKYLKDVRHRIFNAEGTDILFLNFQGRPLTRQGFWKIIKKYIEISEIKGNITAQTLRHCFALHLMENGADARAVSEMLGYSDVSSIKIYTDLLDSRLKREYKKAHPRA